MAAQQQQRLELRHRVDMPKDEVPYVGGNRIIRQPDHDAVAFAIHEGNEATIFDGPWGGGE